jgi:hypothetical protein
MVDPAPHPEVSDKLGFTDAAARGARDLIAIRAPAQLPATAPSSQSVLDEQREERL